MNDIDDHDDFEVRVFIEELRQRYNQYRWEDETRTKFIHFYFIFLLAFWGVIGFLSQPRNEAFIKSLPHGTDLSWLLGSAFILMGIIGTLWLTSIISFRSIQTQESKLIKAIKSKSPKLIEIGSPHEREIFILKTKFYSTSPLSIIIFLFNSYSFYLSYHNYLNSYAPTWKWFSIILSILSLIWLLFFTYYWKPKPNNLEIE